MSLSQNESSNHLVAALNRNSIEAAFRLPSLVFFVLFASLSVFSQSAAPTPTPTAEELRLQEEKRLLELRRDIEQAKKAIRDAQPQPSATPLAGDTNLSDVRLEAEMVSYKSMSEAAKKITDDIHNNAKSEGNKITITNLAIYDAQVVKDWRFYQALFPAFEGQVKDIKRQYQSVICSDKDVSVTFKKLHCDSTSMAKNAPLEASARSLIIPEAVPEAFAAGSTFVKSFVDLAALFRTDTKIEGKAVAIDESALVAELFRALRSKYSCAKFYYPRVFPPRVSKQSETMTIVGELFLFKAEADRLIKKNQGDNEVRNAQLGKNKAARQKLTDQLEPLLQFQQKWHSLEDALQKEMDQSVKKKLEREILRLKVEIAKIVPPQELAGRMATLQAQINKLDDDEIKPLKRRIAESETAIKALSDVNDRFQRFVDQYIKVDSSGTNAFVLFIKSEDIENAMKDPNSYWLEIKSVSAGGNNRVRKNLIWYFAGARVDHSGGVIIEYTLYDLTGAVVWSDKLSHYEGYVAPKNIRSEKFKDPIP